MKWNSRLYAFIIISIATLLCGKTVFAETPQDVPTQQTAPVISLLTCGATDDYVFYLYGHTALRVQYEGQDIVFNYGHFSMEQENFILNFVLGRPMYSVGVTPMEQFLYEYGAQGRSVVEQVLNLKPDEASELYRYLLWNIQPEHRDYKYNFYFDNCATKPRDLIEEYSAGIVYYPHLQRATLPTFREAIRSHSYTAGWYTMGADLCLGWKSDQPMTVQDAAFLPIYLEQLLDNAVRKDDGTPLVVEKQTLIPQTHEVGVGARNTTNQPIWVLLGLVVVYFLFMLLDKVWDLPLPLKILRCVLYLILAIGGVVIWFLALVSSHPHTWPNANMLLFHPFYFLLLIPPLWKRYKSGALWLYFVNFVAIIIYVGLSFVQSYPAAIFIFAFLMLFDMWRQWVDAKRSANHTK